MDIKDIIATCFLLVTFLLVMGLITFVTYVELGWWGVVFIFGSIAFAAMFLWSLARVVKK